MALYVPAKFHKDIVGAEFISACENLGVDSDSTNSYYKSM